MAKWLFCLLLVLAGTLPGPPAHARAQRVDAVEVELIADRAMVQPGQPLQLGLRIRHDPHWHTYWRNPGDSGLPTQLELALPAGFSAGAIRWPAPQRMAVGPLMNFGYDGEIVLPVPLTVPATLDGSEVRFAGHAQWLVCKDVCIPGEARLELSLPVAAPGARVPDAPRLSLFETMAARIPVRALQGRAAVSGQRLSLGLPGESPRSAEFFPYADDLMLNAAAQELFDAGAEGGRLQVRLAPKIDLPALQTAGFFDRPAGVVVVDGVPHELSVRAADVLPEGRLIARVEAAESGRQASSAGGGIRWPESRNDGAPAAVSPAAGAATDLESWFGSGSTSLGLAVLFALLGGLVLNLMPCVFPVIGLKVLAFADSGRTDVRIARRNALAFAAGVLLSFWLLAGVLAALRAAGEAVGWGFQLQSPVFVGAMALLFVAIGLNLAGLYEFGLAATRLERPGGAGHPGAALASGGLAVLVATPCTAPFMGSALGFTLGRPVVEVAAVFTALGVGMALPYLLLGWFPMLLRWLPKPGRWMQTLRQALAFPMFATAAWLAWVLGIQAGLDAVFGLTLGMVLLSLAAWSYGRFVQQGAARLAGSAAALLALAAAVWVAWPPVPPEGAAAGPPRGEAGLADWQPWSSDAVADARSAGLPVFVDFTAAWCVSCQANKKLVLERAPVAQVMNRHGVVRLRADWTRRDALIGAELARHGRNGVPLYLVYLPGRDQPLILPELLTTDIVARAFEPAGSALAADRSAAQAVPVR